MMEPSAPPETDNSDDSTGRPQQFFIMALAFEVGLAVLALAFGWLLGFNPLSTWRWSMGDLIWTLLATLPLLVLLRILDRYPVGPLIQLRKLVQELVVPLFRGLRFWQLGAIALAAGLGEELLFRGLIQGGLETLLGRWFSSQSAQAAALGLASILFGLAHLISKTYAALCFVMGLYLGALWLATGNLLVPVTVHALYDFLALTYLLHQQKGRNCDIQ